MLTADKHKLFIYGSAHSSKVVFNHPYLEMLSVGDISSLSTGSDLLFLFKAINIFYVKLCKVYTIFL
jgi:hypothetical protein